VIDYEVRYAFIKPPYAKGRLTKGRQMIKSDFFTMNAPNNTTMAQSIVSKGLLSPLLQHGFGGNGSHTEAHDSTTDIMHSGSISQSSSSSSIASGLLTMVKDYTSGFLNNNGESRSSSNSLTSSSLLSSSPRTTTGSTWRSISSSLDETSDDGSSVSMASKFNSSISNSGNEESVESTTTTSTVSSLTKMISQWTSTENSLVDGAASSSLHEDTVSWPSASSILPSSSSSEVTSASHSSSTLSYIRASETYLKDTKLSRFATWVSRGSSELMKDHIAELPRSLPLTDLEDISGEEGGGVAEHYYHHHVIGYGVSTIGGPNGGANFTNESFFGNDLLDNCTFLNVTDGVNCTGLGVDNPLGYNYWALLLIVFSVFAVFGNVLVILSVKRERSLWNVTNYFIVSLAVADLLVAAVVMPFGVYFLVSLLLSLSLFSVLYIPCICAYGMYMYLSYMDLLLLAILCVKHYIGKNKGHGNKDPKSIFY
jgi:hypothetical protein